MDNNIDPIFNDIFKAHGLITERPTDPLVDLIKSLNPKKEEQAILIYGREYKLWRDGEYIGTAIFTEDNNVGDSFQRKEMGEHGPVIHVHIPDKWELVINK